jgi:hypothetical protein
MSDVTSDGTFNANPITRRPFAFWAAMAVLMIFASSTVALWLATALADLMG